MPRPLRPRPLPSRREILQPGHEDWMRVIRKYARPNHHGQPMKCMPSPFNEDEQDLKHKYIYDSEAIAQQCAAELRALGSPRLWSYPCPRSRHGHAHLTSKRRPQEHDHE